MWKAFEQTREAIERYGLPQKRPRKALIQADFPGSNFPHITSVFPHIIPLLPPQGDPGTGLGAVGHAPIGGDGPAADGTGLKLRPGPLGQEGGFQRRIKGQNGLPEVAAVGTRPAFPEHIALALQGQAPVFLVIVGAPLCYQGADFLFSSRVSSRAKPSPPASRGFQKLPVAGHTADAPPVGAPGAPGAPGRFGDRRGLGTGLLLHHFSKGLSVNFICPPPLRYRPPRPRAGRHRPRPRSRPARHSPGVRRHSPPGARRLSAVWGAVP